MPTYTFVNKNTNEREEHRMSYTVLDQFKLDNPHLEQHIFVEDFLSTQMVIAYLFQV
jgi:hypothetical protein